jgi:hypothetical protein
MRIGVAPTSSERETRAAAREFDPTMRWIWLLESIAVSRAGGEVVMAAMMVERHVGRPWKRQERRAWTWRGAWFL